MSTIDLLRRWRPSGRSFLTTLLVLGLSAVTYAAPPVRNVGRPKAGSALNTVVKKAKKESASTDEAGEEGAKEGEEAPKKKVTPRKTKKRTLKKKVTPRAKNVRRGGAGKVVRPSKPQSDESDDDDESESEGEGSSEGRRFTESQNRAGGKISQPRKRQPQRRRAPRKAVTQKRAPQKKVRRAPRKTQQTVAAPAHRRRTAAPVEEPTPFKTSRPKRTGPYFSAGWGVGIEVFNLDDSLETGAQQTFDVHLGYALTPNIGFGVAGSFVNLSFDLLNDYYEDGIQDRDHLKSTWSVFRNTALYSLVAGEVQLLWDFSPGVFGYFRLAGGASFVHQTSVEKGILSAENGYGFSIGAGTGVHAADYMSVLGGLGMHYLSPIIKTKEGTIEGLYQLGILINIMFH